MVIDVPEEVPVLFVSFLLPLRDCGVTGVAEDAANEKGKIWEKAEKHYFTCNYFKLNLTIYTGSECWAMIGEILVGKKIKQADGITWSKDLSSIFLNYYFFFLVIYKGLAKEFIEWQRKVDYF